MLKIKIFAAFSYELLQFESRETLNFKCFCALPTPPPKKKFIIHIKNNKKMQKNVSFQWHFKIKSQKQLIYSLTNQIRQGPADPITTFLKLQEMS